MVIIFALLALFQPDDEWNFIATLLLLIEAIQTNQ